MEAFCGSCGSLLVSLEVFSPAQILLIVHTTVIRHSVFSFSSFFYISSFWNLEICSCLYSSLLSILFILLFFPTLLSAPCSVLSVYLSHFIFWSHLLFYFQICCPFFSLFLLLYSLCFSLMVYYVLFNLFSYCDSSPFKNSLSNTSLLLLLFSLYSFFLIRIQWYFLLSLPFFLSLFSLFLYFLSVFPEFCRGFFCFLFVLVSILSLFLLSSLLSFICYYCITVDFLFYILHSDPLFLFLFIYLLFS